MSRPLEFTGRIRSFRYAGRGIWLVLKTQPNAWIHAGATAAAIAAGWLLGISRLEWCVIVLTCAAVWTAEALNTAFEHLADATKPEFDPVIGKAKDVAAGAVLVTALAAVVVGFLVFGPHLLVLVKSGSLP